MIYQYRCPKCKRIYELPRAVAQRNAPYWCPHCNVRVQRMISGGSTHLNTGKGSRIPGMCNVLPGKKFYCRSKRHFREECKKHDVRPVGLE